MSRLHALVFLTSCGVAMSLGEAAKPFIFEGFQAGSNVILPGRRGTSLHFDVSTKVWNVVCVTGAILLQGFLKMSSISRGRRSTLDTSIVILRARCSTLDTCSCVFFATRIVRVQMSFCVAGAVFVWNVIDFALHIPHSTLYT